MRTHQKRFDHRIKPQILQVRVHQFLTTAVAATTKKDETQTKRVRPVSEKGKDKVCAILLWIEVWHPAEKWEEVDRRTLSASRSYWCLYLSHAVVTNITSNGKQVRKCCTTEVKSQQPIKIHRQSYDSHKMRDWLEHVSTLPSSTRS
jgi:hypothetical protein